MTTPTGTEAAVCADIAQRQQLGITKYGTTVADNPLPLRDWLQHAYEETLDLPIYLRRAIEEMDTACSASFTVSEMQDIADALYFAMDDIRQLLQVAKYNLRGQINSELIEKPNPPILIHEQGITQSEAIIERCRKTWLMVWQRIPSDEPNHPASPTKH